MSSHQRAESHPARYTLKVPGTGRLWRWVAFGLGPLLLLALLFWGDKSVLHIWALLREDRNAQRQIETLETKNQRLRGQIGVLRQDPKAVERIAREELGFVKPDEIVYRFVPPQRGDVPPTVQESREKQ
ncbi:MAG: septum formation initiator family protein [candidate division FCPU426 bacterium]